MMSSVTPLGPLTSLQSHWPEYLIEAGALGCFMLSAAVWSTLLSYPDSPVAALVQDGVWRRACIGIAMGLTAVALIYSPWGRRSGAHMNPAVTLTYWRLGRVARWDGIFYIAAQFVGGACGVLLAAALLQDAFRAPPVAYVGTHPGTHGAAAAFAAELAISALLMTVVLRVSNAPRHSHYTGLCAGLLVAAFIALEAPLSGMSMNPARSFASALPARQWQDLWIYFTAPVLGMQAAAAWHVIRRGRQSVRCAKLVHTADQRCIHCGYGMERPVP